jgi:transcriptional regulator with XRE-family HTH domain
MDKTIYTREYAALLRVLRSKRKESGITQVQLAEKLDMTQSAYSKLERGELRIDVIQLRTISRVLGLTLLEFVTALEKAIRKPSKKKLRSRRK